MKKYIFIGFLILTVTMFFGCPGQPGYEPPSTGLSTVLGGNQPEISLIRIGNVQQNGLVGMWQAKTDEFKTFSQISFDKNDQYQEKVYSELTNELLNAYEGSYTATNDILIVMLTSGESYRFMYTLSGDYLKISQ